VIFFRHSDQNYRPGNTVLLVLASASCMVPGSQVRSQSSPIYPAEALLSPAFPECLPFVSAKAQYSVIDRSPLQDCLLDGLLDAVSGVIPPRRERFSNQTELTVRKQCNNNIETYI
jgi:hypothetical protein